MLFQTVRCHTYTTDCFCGVVREGARTALGEACFQGVGPDPFLRTEIKGSIELVQEVILNPRAPAM